MIKIYFVAICVTLFFSCSEKKDNVSISLVDSTSISIDSVMAKESKHTDLIYISQNMPADIMCDLDGDSNNDTISLMLDTLTSKYGLIIIYAAGKCDTLGMGKEFLDRGFDDFNWVGIMEVAPKGKFYWNYINYEDSNIPHDQIADEDKITLKKDGIFLHASESCGGGVIYLTDENQYAWMQQE